MRKVYTTLFPTFALAISSCAFFPPALKQISFPTDDAGLIFALEYGKGSRGVVLAHGGRWNKESWDAQATFLAKRGFHVLSIDHRGFGQSRGPIVNGQVPRSNEARYLDVLAAAQYLRSRGATSVTAVGASMGGDAVAKAADSNPTALDRIVLLASGAYTPLAANKSPKLFIMAAEDIIGDGDLRITKIREQYEKASEPKRFVVLAGSAHAQALFQTDQGPQLMDEILRFLSDD